VKYAGELIIISNPKFCIVRCELTSRYTIYLSEEILRKDIMFLLSLLVYLKFLP